MQNEGSVIRSPHPSRFACRLLQGSRQRSGAHPPSPSHCPLRAKGQKPAPAWASLRRPCGQSSDCDLPRNQTFCGCKRSRTVGGGILKGGTVGDSLKWRSFGTFLSTQTEKYIEYRPWMIPKRRVAEIHSPHPSRFACHLLQGRRQGSGAHPPTPKPAIPIPESAEPKHGNARSHRYKNFKILFGKEGNTHEHFQGCQEGRQDRR